MKNLLEKYNTPESLIVLSTFPGKNSDLSAIDRYNEKKLADIAKRRRVIVCAEQIGDDKMYEFKKNILVTRIWKKSAIFSFIPLLLFILRARYASTILVEFEFNVFGGTLPNFMLLIVLAIARLAGKRIIFELHQVITDIGKLDKHLNVTNPLLQKLYSYGIKLYYRCVGSVSHVVIVLEEELKKRLSTLINQEKIVVLPHHMTLQKPIAKKTARARIGISQKEFVVLVFGYINWYKGVDWIVRASKQWRGKNIRLLIAGGPNPYHINKDYYKKYFEQFLAEAGKEAHITYTGFVPDSKIGLYFSAADLAVLPYRVFMAASGPFSLALSYGVPTIFSEVLSDYNQSADFTLAMRQAKLTKSDLFFKRKERNLYNLISRIKNSSNYYGQLVEFSQLLAQSRSDATVMAQLQAILNPIKSVTPVQPIVKKLAIQS